MRKLATKIRTQLDALAEDYQERLQNIPEFAALPERSKRRNARLVLEAIADDLESDDRAAFSQYVQLQANEWIQRGLDIEPISHAIIELEELLMPLVSTAGTAKFLWRTFSQSRASISVQTTNRLRTSEAQLQALADNTVGMLIHQDGVLEFIGLEGARILGYDAPEQLVGRSIIELVAAEERMRVAGIIRRRLAGRQPPDQFETRLLKRDGTTIDVLMFNKLIEYEGHTATQGTFIDITERKRIAEQAQQAQQMYQVLLDSTPFGIVFINQEKKILRANRAALELMDYEAEEQVIGKLCHDNMCPAQIGQCPVLDLGQDVDMSRRTLITRSGENIPILKSVVHTHLAGQPVLLEAFVDISERLRAEQALQESQQFLQLVVDNIPQTIFWKDEQSVYLGCNYKFAAEHGFSSPADVVGKTDYDLFEDQAKADSFRQVDRRVMDSAAPELHVMQSELQADGQQTWKDSNQIPLHDAEGNVIGILSTCEDITERMQTEGELLRLRSAVEQTADGIAVFDLEGNIQFANPAWAQMHGYEPQEIQNENIALFHTPEQLQREVMPCRQQVLETGVHHCQIGHVKKDQSVFPTMMSNTLLKDEDGVPIGFVATARDITHQVQAEQELQQQSQMLQGVARAAEQLLTIPHPVQAINMALATLGAATGADRVYVFENHPHPASGQLAMSRRFEWCRPPVAPQLDQAEMQNVTYQPFWYDRLSTGNTVNHLTREFPTTIRRALERQDILALLAVPIIIEDQFWGYVGFDDCYSERRWSENEEAVLTIAAGSIGGVIHRQRIEQAVHSSLERRGRQMQISTLIAQRIAAAPTMDELFRRVVTLIKEQFNYYHVQIFRYEPALRAVVTVCGYGEIGEQMQEAGYSLELRRGVIGAAAATGRTVVANDVTQYSNWIPNRFLPDIKSEMAAPIKLRDQVLGILAVQSNRLGAFTADTQLVLEGLCGQIATAIESTRLRQEMEENLRELNAMYHVTSHEGWQDYRDAASLPAGYRFDRTTLQPIRDLWMPEIEQAVREEKLVAGEEEEKKGVAVAPMLARGEVLGVLGVQDIPQRPLSSDDLDLLQAVSEQVSLALESARLFEQTQMALDQTQELYEGSNRVVRATTMDEVLQALVQTTALQRLDRVSFQLFDRPWNDERPTNATVSAVWSCSEDITPTPVGTQFLVENFPAAALMRRDEPIIIPDMAAEERLDEFTRDLLLQQLHMRGLVIYPLIAGEQWIGILMAMSGAPLDLHANEIRQIASLTGQASAVILTMRLVEQTRRALGLTEELYAGSERVVRSTTPEELLHALVRSSALQELDQVALLVLERPLSQAPSEGKGDTALTGVTPTAFWRRAGLPEEQAADVSAIHHTLENFPLLALFSSQQPLIIRDTTTDEQLDANTRQIMSAIGARSAVILPLVAGGQSIGGVIARGGAATEMREGQVRRMISLAEQAATVLQSQLLFDQTQAALVETQVLHQAGAELNAARSYEEILTVLRNHTVLGQADRLASIDLFDRPWVEDDWPDWVIVIVRWPKLSRQQADSRYLTQDYPSLFELLRADEPMIISDVESDPRLDDNLRALFLERFQARSTISIPLVVGGQWLGYVNGQYSASTQFSETEMRRLITLTSQAAVAVQSLRQLEDIQARVQREQQLREITARLRTPPSVDGVMRVLAQELGQVLGRRTAVRLERQGFMNVAAADQKPGGGDADQ